MCFCPVLHTLMCGTQHSCCCTRNSQHVHPYRTPCLPNKSHTRPKRPRRSHLRVSPCDGFKYTLRCSAGRLGGCCTGCFFGRGFNCAERSTSMLSSNARREKLTVPASGTFPDPLFSLARSMASAMLSSYSSCFCHCVFHIKSEV